MSAAGLYISIDDVAKICQRYGVSELSLFGSTVRNEDGPDSDVDLLVAFAPGTRIGLMAFAALKDEFAAVLGRPVDLVPKDGLKPAIRDSVLRNAKVVYAA